MKTKLLQLAMMMRHPMDHLFLVMCRRRGVAPLLETGVLQLAQDLGRAGQRLEKSGALNDGTSRRIALKKKLRSDYQEAFTNLLASAWYPLWSMGGGR